MRAVLSSFWVVVGVVAFLATAGCALRRPTVSRSHEAALGLGGVGHLTGSQDSEEEPREVAGAAAVWRASYARCLNKGEYAVCIEVPVDGIPVTRITSPNRTAPQSYSTLTLTPGLRIESNELPGGFLPLNFIAIGLGAARYTSSGTRLDGTTGERQRTTTFSLRVDLGLTVRVRERLGVRVGVFIIGGEERNWLQRLGVLPAGASVSDSRVGGYGVLYFRR